MAFGMGLALMVQIYTADGQNPALPTLWFARLFLVVTSFTWDFILETQTSLKSGREPANGKMPPDILPMHRWFEATTSQKFKKRA